MSDSPLPLLADEISRLLESTLAGSLVVDREGRILRHSGNCRRLFPDWPQAPCQLRQLPALAALATPLAQAFASGEDVEQALELGKRSVLARLLPLQGTDGTVERLILSFYDETERRSSEERLEALVESTPDPIIIVEADGSIQRSNRQVESLFGYSREELLGRSYQLLIPERYRQQHLAYHKQYQARPVMRQMGSGLELSCLTRSGEEVPVEIGLSPVQVGSEITTLVRLRDIRQEKREQEILNAARQKAIEANRTKSRFLAAASHDLRQPLQSISMYLGALAGDIAGADKARVIDQARMALDSTNRLLNALLNISKLESGKVQPERRAFNVQELLQRVHNLEAPQAAEKGLCFRLLGSSATVHTDPGLLEQLVSNLVANAVKYTPPGGRVLLGCRRRAGELKIQVSDSGAGIASSQLDIIFDEYRQLEYSGHYLGKGLGLGLSIVKLIAELLQLRLEVKSLPGRGSSFSVWVPLAAQALRPEARPGDEATPAAHYSGTLLLIEDDPAVMDSTSLFLELSGFTVLTAASAEEAQAQLSQQLPDLIISDYGLGETANGIEVVTALRRSLGRDIPAIVITGDTSDSRAQEAAAAGCALTCKPIEAQSMLALVQRQLSGSRP